MAELILKWGTIKGFEKFSDVQQKAAKAWADYESSHSARNETNLTEYIKLLINLIDLMEDGHIHNDYSGATYTKEQAKDYINTYYSRKFKNINGG